MANATRKLRNLQPATGSVRWAAQPTARHPGCLVITANRSKGETVTETYLVHANRDGGQLVGYRLQKKCGKVYDLPATLDSCDCPDFVHGRAHATTPELRACKHCRALRQALAALER